MEGEQLDAQTVIAVQRNRIMELEDNLTQALSLANQYKDFGLIEQWKSDNPTDDDELDLEDVKPEGTKMKFQVLRFSSQVDSSNGLLFKINDDGSKKFLCYTLEDEKEIKK